MNWNWNCVSAFQYLFLPCIIDVHSVFGILSSAVLPQRFMHSLPMAIYAHLVRGRPFGLTFLNLQLSGATAANLKTVTGE